jgi:tetratricopeptide (TPR) repeat protein
MYWPGTQMTTSTDFESRLAAGLAASREGRLDAALTFFAKACEADPSSGVPHFLIGSEHAAAGDFAAAELAFARAVLLAPQFTLARYQLGLLQFTSQRAPVALLTWEPLLALPETDALPHFVRGFTALAADAFDEALRHYRNGLACSPTNAALCSDILQLVDAVEKLQRKEDASPQDEEAQHVFLSAYARGLH